MLRKRFLKILINLSALFCVAIFILARVDKLPLQFLDKDLIESENNGEAGDLYYMCRVDFFKTRLPQFQPSFILSGKNYNINEADILIYGDSYFASSRVLKNFPEIIADSLNLKVHSESQSFPLKSLINDKYIKGRKKYLIYEATERRIFEDFKKTHTSQSEGRQFLSNTLAQIIPYNLEFNYQYILQRSVLSSKLYSLIMNIKFDYLGLISDITPVYSTNPLFLFYYQNVNNKNTSFYYRFSDQELSNISDNIQILSEVLLKEYNLELIFMPIPSSYTMNHNILNNDIYNNFLPRLHSELTHRKIRNVNIYDKYLNSKILLYYPTDTHWNDDGMKIAFFELKRVMLNNNY